MIGGMEISLFPLRLARKNAVLHYRYNEANHGCLLGSSMNEGDIVKRTTTSPQVPVACVEILEPKHAQGNGENNQYSFGGYSLNGLCIIQLSSPDAGPPRRRSGHREDTWYMGKPMDISKHIVPVNKL